MQNGTVYELLDCACAGDSDAFLKDMQSDSDDEGSSFFGDNADKDDSDDEDGVNQQDAVLPAQRVKRAAHDATSASAVASDLAAHPAIPAAADDARSAKSSGSKGFAFRFPESFKAKAAARDSSLQPSAAKANIQQPQAASVTLNEKARGQSSQAERQPASAAQHANSTVRENPAEGDERSHHSSLVRCPVHRSAVLQQESCSTPPFQLTRLALSCISNVKHPEPVGLP